MDDTHSVTLRAATEADFPFLLALRKATMTEHLERVGEPVDARSHALRARARLGDARVVCVDGRPVGVVKAYRDFQDPDDARWFVMQIQILPAFQRRGLGAHLIGVVLDAAAKERASVALHVLKGNPARQLYERLGFRVTGETDIEHEMTWRPPPGDAPARTPKGTPA